MTMALFRNKRFMLDEMTWQNLPYFINSKTQSCFFHFSFRATLFYPLMNAPVYVDIDQGIHKVA